MFMAAKISIIFQSSKLFRVIVRFMSDFFVNLATIRTFASSNDRAARTEPNEFELCRVATE